MRAALAIAAAWAIYATPVASLTFTPGNEAGSVIFAEGAIEAGDAETLFDLVHDDETITHVVFQSGGGSVVEALRIGRLIRSFDMNTLVEPDGHCLSACFFAFAGGVDRGVPATAQLGVHQFSGTGEGETAERAQALAQTLTAELLAYVDEMGLDVGVMAAALRTAPHDMHVFSRAELEQLSIDPLAVRMTEDAADDCPFPSEHTDIRDSFGWYPQCADRPGYRGPAYHSGG